MRDSTPDWRQLSALYDHAEGLGEAERAAWLEALERDGHPQWRLLRSMWGTRRPLADTDFLESLPRWLEGADDGEGPRAHAGESFGPYRLLRPLGAGGMAEVWLAERADGAFERQVALKLLFAPAGGSRQAAFRRRFEREHRILAGLRHPHIAALHDAGVTVQGQHWLALEYVDGQPIDAWCDARGLGIRARVQLFLQVVQAVSHAHARLVIHRDIKPSNVLVHADGGARLLDFGIATLLDPDGGATDATELTRMGGRPLTLRFASPEQIQGQPLDVTTDVYSLGVVLYEVLCGSAPFGGTGTARTALEQAILGGEALAPSRHAATAQTLAARRSTAHALRRELSPDLDAIVLRAMSRESSHRYGSADALASDLQRWLAGEPVHARLPGPVTRAWKFMRRHPWGTALGTLSVLALGVATAMATVKAGQAQAEAGRARAASDFMQNLFDDADPDRHGGASLTPAQLLARGRSRLTSDPKVPPLLRADLLEGIARAQTQMHEFDDAEATFGQWVALCQAQCEPSRLAWALTWRAENDLHLRRYAPAREGVARSESVLPDGAAPAALRAKRSEVLGWVAHYEGRLDEAARAFDAGIEALRADDPAASPLAVELWLGVAQNEAERGAEDKALRALDAAASGVATATALPAGTAHYLAAMRAEVWDRLAQYGRVAHGVPADLARCEQRFNAASATCTQLRTVLWRAWMRLGHAGRLAAEWPALLRTADGRASEPVRVGTLQLANRLAAQSGDAQQRAQSAERVQALERDGRGAGTRARMALALAEAALYADQPAQATAHLQRSRAHVAGETVPDPYLASQMGLIDGLAAQSLGRPREALAAMDQAQAGFEAMLGVRHPLALWLGLNRVGPLLALGERPRATAALDAALPVLLQSLGPDAPSIERLRRLRDDLAQHGPAALGARVPFDPFL